MSFLKKLNPSSPEDIGFGSTWGVQSLKPSVAKIYSFSMGSWRSYFTGLITGILIGALVVIIITLP